MTDLTLPEFIRARVAEDEAWANEALALASIYRQDSLSWHWVAAHDDGSRWMTTTHDPARVLAQCAAYRSIVELHHPDRHLENWYWLERKCAECGHIWHKWVPDKKPTDIGPEQGCPTMRALATIWADHPDFRPEWRL